MMDGTHLARLCCEWEGGEWPGRISESEHFLIIKSDSLNQVLCLMLTTGSFNAEEALAVPTGEPPLLHT